MIRVPNSQSTPMPQANVVHLAQTDPLGEAADQEMMYRLSLEFMVTVSNVLYGMDKERRHGCMKAIAHMVSTLDTLPSELEPELIFAADSDRMVITFNGDPTLEPLIYEI